MIETPLPPRRRRFRLTIRATMLAIPILSLVLLYALGINPFRRDAYSIALENRTEWCSSNLDNFQADGHFDHTKPEPVYVIDRPKSFSVACLVKIADVHRQRSDGIGMGCDIDSHAIAVDGRHSETHDIYSWAIQGGQGTIPAKELIEMRKLVAALPASQWWIPEGKTLVVGLSSGNTWETRTYDKDHLPPEVTALVAKLKMRSL